LLAATVTDSDRAMDVELVTSEGTIIIRLSDKTPLHRDNFIKNVKEGYYDNIRYHRIIENFVIQVGNPEFKDPPLESEPGLAKDEDIIPIELDDSLYHRRGALSAARKSDIVNPKQNSSAAQFVIVQGKLYPDEEVLAKAESRINGYLAFNSVVNNPKNKEKMERLQALDKLWPFQEENQKQDKEEYEQISADLQDQADTLVKEMEPYRIPDWQREVYRTKGGNAHSDRSYTVFGSVAEGMSVVDRIAAVETDEQDAPTGDVRIVKARLIERKDYAATESVD